MNSKCLLIAIIIVYLVLSEKTSEIPNKENFRETSVSRQCSSIYGYNHPKCQMDNSSKLEHVGYFKINTIKYPVIDFVNEDSKIRYLLLNNKFYKFKEKYWHRGYYFKNSLSYNRSIPISFISTYTFRGVLVNNPTRRKLFAFGKRLNSEYYKYILFREKDKVLQYAYSIPYRTKIVAGDSIFVRNQISTYGPFVFYQN